MTPITDTDELKRIELGILRDVARFCESHGIRYFLSGGTLLGAVRHKGFIPWDDDVDIAMLRPDYERFLCEYKSDRYAIRSLESDSYLAAFAKVVDVRTHVDEIDVGLKKLGVWLDVFPLDGAPSREYNPHRSLVWRFLKKAIRFRNLPFSGPGRTLKQRIGILLSSPIRLLPNRFLVGRLRAIAMRYSVNDSPYIGCLVGPYTARRELQPRNVFDGEDARVTFEGETFRTMPGWRDYLTSLYGDYMTLPPLEKRKSTHNFKAWWKDATPVTDSNGFDRQVPCKCP